MKQKKVKGGTDQRVFITKTEEEDKKASKKSKKNEKGKKTRPISPKFFVTLDGEKKADEDTKVTHKPLSPAKQQTDHLIIHPNITSDDSDDESSKNIFKNNTAQEEAAKIKQLQAQNPLPPMDLGIKEGIETFKRLPCYFYLKIMIKLKV